MLKRFVLLATASLLLAACSSNQPLTAAGAQVQFVDQYPAANCQFLGKVEGSRSTFFSGTKSHSELVRDAAQDLRNKAGAMGGNTVYQVQDISKPILSDLVPTDVEIRGDVYRCP